MSKFRTAAAAGMLGLVIVVSAAQPAQAARWDGSDRAGDAAPGVDISRVTVWNGPVTLVTKVSFHDLRKSRVGAVGTIIDTGPRNGEAYLAQIKWSRTKSRFAPSMFRLSELGDASPSTRIACAGTDSEWQAGVAYSSEWVKIRVPQRCLGADAGPVRLTATTGVRRGDGDGDVSPELGSRQYRKQLIRRG